MPATFTEITDLTDLQDKAIHNELRDAFNERYSIHSNLTLYSPISAGADIQARSYWAGYQTNLIDAVNSFIDPAYDPHLNPAPAPYEISQWMIDAGIPYGFRRVAGANWPSDWTDYNDPAYSYGKIQTGDIIGPWLIVDLQNGLNALRRTYYGISTASSYTGAERIAEGIDPDCNIALTEQINNWTSSSWGGSAGIASVSIHGDASHWFKAWRRKTKPKSLVYRLFTDTTYDIKLYAAPQCTSGYNPSLKTAYGFTDDVWNYTGESDTSVMADEWEASTYYGDGFDSNPITDEGISCPISPCDKGYVITFFFIYDWTFKYHL